MPTKRDLAKLLDARWQPAPIAGDVRREAARWIRVILEDPTMPADARYRRLDAELWAYTEIKRSNPFKYNLRYRTLGVQNGPDDVKIHHEHVVPRRWLIHTLIDHPDQAFLVLSLSASCATTEAESKQLSANEASFGWARYARAGLIVIDGETGTTADLESLHQDQLNVLEQLGIEPSP